jgi:glycine C-acetyltransferase
MTARPDVLAFIDGEGAAGAEPDAPVNRYIFESMPAATALVAGRRMINLASNNYLGLASDPAVMAAAVAGIEQFGVGTGGSATGAGTTALHLLLAQRIAQFEETEAALLLPAGFLANVGTIPALVGPGDVIVSDELNHPSILDGARLAGAQVKVYEHGNVAQAEAHLLDAERAPRRLLVTNGVFSLDGDLARLPELAAAAARQGAILMVDDAHGTGVIGRGGRGTADHFRVREHVDVQVGTLSKALGAQGGFVAGSARMIGWLSERARPYLFSTSLAPPLAAAAIAALDVLEREPDRVERLQQRAEFFRGALHSVGVSTGSSVTALVPLMVGDPVLALQMSRLLWADGVLIPPLVPPTVAPGRARLRAIVTSEHSETDLATVAQACGRAARALGL